MNTNRVDIFLLVFLLLIGCNEKSPAKKIKVEKSLSIAEVENICESQLMISGDYSYYNFLAPKNLNAYEKEVLSRNSYFPNSHFIHYDFTGDGRKDIGILCQNKKDLEKTIYILPKRKIGYGRPKIYGFGDDYFPKGFGLNENNEVIIPAYERGTYYSFNSNKDYWEYHNNPNTDIKQSNKEGSFNFEDAVGYVMNGSIRKALKILGNPDVDDVLVVGHKRMFVYFNKVKHHGKLKHLVLSVRSTNLSDITVEDVQAVSDGERAYFGIHYISINNQNISSNSSAWGRY